MAAEIYVGLDTAAYPGENWARRVYNETNIRYLSYYLGGPNAAAGTETWLGNRKTLVGISLGLIPIYVGQQVDGTRFYDDLTIDRGAADGRDAARLMREEGFPSGSVCYLDVEDRTYTEDLLTYVSTWVKALATFGFRAGVYCDAAPGGVADALFAKTEGSFYLWAVPKGEDIWISVQPDADANGYQTYPTYDPKGYHQRAYGVQYAEAGFSDNPPTVFGAQVDLNSFFTKDPSAPDKEEEPIMARPGYPERQLDVTSDGWPYDTATNSWVSMPGHTDENFRVDASGWPKLSAVEQARQWPEANDPIIPNSASYQERHPTRYAWRFDVEKWAEYLVDNFDVSVNTYHDHPEGYARTEESIDIWGPAGRNDPLDRALGDQILNLLFNDPNLPNIDWIIWQRQIWTRASGVWSPFGTDPFSYHEDHIHCTYV